jgi:hypothetical protein
VVLRQRIGVGANRVSGKPKERHGKVLFINADWRLSRSNSARIATASNSRSIPLSMALRARPAAELLLTILHDDMRAIVERYVAAQRKKIVAAFENWWDKYRVTLTEIEGKRDAAAEVLVVRDEPVVDCQLHG